MSVSLDDAQRECEAITRRRAQNFYYGIRLLPPAKRRAMCAAYGFARRVDDIADGELPADEKLRLLGAERAKLAAPGSATEDPVMVALADALARFPLPVDAFEDLLDGVEMDVRETEYARFDELERYCRRVAGSIGRICVGIFGAERPEQADRLADDLGVGMQLTNILRDVREDAGRGRTYLPAEDLERFGCEDGLASAPSDARARLLRFEAARARERFEQGLGLIPLLDARSASCVLAMSGIYLRLLDRIEADPEAAMRRRLSLPPWEKAWVAARSLTGAGASAMRGAVGARA